MKRVISIVLALLLLAAPAPAFAETKIEPNSPIVLVGSFAVGSSVSVLYPVNEPSIATTFQWFANEVPIASANGSSIAITQDLLSKVLSAKVTLKKQGSSDVEIQLKGAKVFSSAPSGGTMGWNGEQVNQPGCFSPRPSGVPIRIGWQLVFLCQPYNTNFGNDVQAKFSWYRNGQLIEQANAMAYRLQPQDAGQDIWGAYEVTYSNGFVFMESKKQASKILKTVVLAKPTILGSVKLNSTLLARTTGSDTSAQLSYQWYREYAPIAGATSSAYLVKQQDLGKALQVLVSASRDDFAPSTVLSAVVSSLTNTPVNAALAYSKIFKSYSPTQTAYDITYFTSPTVSEQSLDREKALVQRAADFWLPEYTPKGVTVLYITKDDASWAEKFLAERPSWSSGIPGGIRSWIDRNSCGFALAFKADQKQVFVQCVKNGAENSINDQQVGPHEYSHWFQYEQTPNLYLNKVPWLIEGQANFFGLALGIAPEDLSLSFINTSLAGHATQFDMSNGYKFADFKMLDILQSTDMVDVQILLDRGGTVWDQYALGTLLSEWLVLNYGVPKYLNYTKNLLKNKGSNTASEEEANALAFKSEFGFEFNQLAIHAGPYLAARAAQLRSAWAETRKNDITFPTKGSTQLLPVFAAKSKVLNQNQRDWIEKRIGDGPILSLVCDVKLTAKTKPTELALFKSQAKAACDYASAGIAKQSRTVKVQIKTSKSTKTADAGKVFISFGG